MFLFRTGPALSRFVLIGPGAKEGPALRLLTNTNFHFLSKLIVYIAARGLSFFKVFGETKTVLKLFQL